MQPSTNEPMVMNYGVEVKNYMGGTSYTLNPLQTLQLVSTSMICGENQYYRINNVEKHKNFINYYDNKLM